MNRCVLFSCAGSTDPIRDNYDGPMLHIVRHYRPHTVYVFLSAEMGAREKKDRRFSRAIELLGGQMGYPVAVELIFSGIDNPHDFDAFIGVFNECLARIAETFPDDRILLNVSSGTPQMMAMLCLETVVSSKPLIPVQVTTPAARANQSKMGGLEYDVEWEFHNNLDNEPDAPNRCLRPDILSFKRTLAKGQVLALLKKYNYEEAALILKGYGVAEDAPVMKLLRFAAGKKNLDPAANSPQLAEAKNAAGYPKTDGECQEICEYFNVVKLLQRTGHLTDFLLRLNPLVTKLQTKFLEYRLGFSMELITEEQRFYGKRPGAAVSPERLVRRAKIEAVNPSLLAYVDECHYGGYRDGGYVNIKLQNCLISYFLRSSSDGQARSFARFLQTMEVLNEDRNLAAHTLCGIPEEEIIRKAGMSSGQIVGKLESLIRYIFQSRCKQEIFSVFDNINAKISLELERSL